MGREDHTEEVLTDNYTTTMVRDRKIDMESHRMRVNIDS